MSWQLFRISPSKVWSFVHFQTKRQRVFKRGHFFISRSQKSIVSCPQFAKNLKFWFSCWPHLAEWRCRQVGNLWSSCRRSWRRQWPPQSGPTLTPYLESCPSRLPRSKNPSLRLLTLAKAWAGLITMLAWIKRSREGTWDNSGPCSR